MSTFNNPRVLIWGALALLLYVDFNAWMTDYAPAVPAPTQAAGVERAPRAAAPASELANRVPEAPAPAAADSGTAPPPAAAGAAATPAVAAGSAPGAALPEAASAPLVHVRTDVLDVEISTRGGT